MTLIIAHRGASYDYPENTLSAINAAWQKGAKAVEVDIHLTADNQIVVIHDSHTGRVGDKKLVVEKSILSELKRIDVGSKKATSYKGEQIPTLNEVLETVPLNSKLIIEVKCGKSIIKPLIELLNNSTLENHQIELISFNLEVLSELKKQLPQFKALWLLDLDYYWPHWLLKINPSKILKTVKDNNLDGVNLWAGKVINESFVQAFKNEGLLVYTWTVNEVNKAQKILNFGVDAITTDRSEWLTKQLING